jgi:hypothetical protein
MLTWASHFGPQPLPPDLQTSLSRFSSVGAEEIQCTGKKLKHNLQCFVFSTTGIKAMTNEVMQVTCSIHRQARVCAEAEGGHFEQLL